LHALDKDQKKSQINNKEHRFMLKTRAKTLLLKTKFSQHNIKERLSLCFICLVFSLLIFVPSFILHSSANSTNNLTQPSIDEAINPLALVQCSNINFDTGFITPRSVATGDIDGDGKIDLIIGSNSTASTSVLRNIGTTGSPVFNGKIDLDSGINAVAVLATDVDGDSKLDIVIANAGGANTLSVLRNTSTPGNISFAPRVTFATGDQPVSLAAGDLDGDGKLDFATANNTGNTTSIFRNTSSVGNISLATKIDLMTGSGPQSALIGDIDGDGKLDLAIGNIASSVSLFRNISTPGTISFDTRLNFSAGSLPRRGAIGDIDGDGKLDLAFADSSSNVVLVLRNTSTSGNISFASTVSFATGSSSFGLTIGDIDGDSKLDLAATNQNSNSVSVLRNTSTLGNISFANQQVFSIGAGSSAVVASDLDADSKLDLVSANDNSNTISILKNTSMVGSISFTTRKNLRGNEFPTGTGPFEVATGDIDGDGKADLVSANRTDNTVSVLRNTSPSTSVFFAPKVDFAVGVGPRSVAIGDIDGDGKLDLAVANSNNNTGGASTVSILRNTSTLGNISFQTQITFTVGNNPNSITIGDIDGDGRLDLAVTNSNILSSNPIQTISVLRNNSSPGSISFDNQLTFNVGSKPGSIAIGDIDGDGKLDLAVANSDNISNVNVVPDTVSVLRNTSSIGAISFDNQLTFPTGTIPASVKIGDIDGDGKPELVVGETNTSNISIFRNTSSIGVISFDTKIDFNTGSGAKAISLGDLNGDNKLDIVSTASNEAKIAVFRNTSSIGSITLATRADFLVGENPFSSTIEDFDKDNRFDIATANLTGNNASVLRNICLGQVCPTITLSPTSLAMATRGVAYSQTITASGGTAPYIFSVTSGVLPTGITLSSAGLLSGTTTQTGSFQITITATDANNCTGSQSYTLTVTAGVSNNTLYVADTLNNRVQRSIDNGMSWQFVGNGPGTAPGQFNAPRGVAANFTDTIIFVADTNNNRIQRSTDGGASWTVLATPGTATNQVNKPNNLAYDETNNKLYVADTMNNRILVISNAANVNPVFEIFAGATAGTIVGKVNQPQSVAVNSTGMVYVADTLNNRIQMNTNGLTNGWTILATAGTAIGQMNAPKGIYIDDSGRIWVADTSNNRIQVNINGAWSVFMGGGTAIGSVNRPEAMVVNLSGNLFIADTGNNRIQSKPVNGGSASLVGGPGTALGKFNQPSGIR
jgi:sugar lactone lactonase YvrE